LNVEVPDVEADDGTTITCFSIEFPHGATIPAHSSSKSISECESTVKTWNLPFLITANPVTVSNTVCIFMNEIICKLLIESDVRRNSAIWFVVRNWSLCSLQNAVHSTCGL